MAYITSEYYSNEYKGKYPNNPEELLSTIKRASENIDNITGYKLKMDNVDFDKLNPFIKQQVEIATAKLTEYYILNGGYETFIEKDDIASAYLGSFSYNKKQSNEKDITTEIPNSVINALEPTGLLYNGVNTRWL